MERITLKKPPKRIVVLGEGENEYEFEVLRITRDIEAKLGPLATRLEELQLNGNADTKDRVEAMAAQLDVILKSTNAKAPKPSEFLVGQFEENEITLLELGALVEDVVASGRPT